MNWIQTQFQNRRLFWGILIISVLVKVLIVIFLTPVVLGAYPANDSRTYDRLGWKITNQWRSGHWESPALATQTGLRIVAFSYIVGAIYFLVGRQPIAVQWVNILISTLGAWLFFLASRKMQAKGAEIAFLLIAFWPSLLLWTSLPLKEAWTFMLVGLLAYGVVLMMERSWLPALSSILGSLAGLLLLRPWLATVAIVGIFPWWLGLYFRDMWQQQTASQRTSILVLILGIAGAIVYLGVQFSVVTSPFSLETLNILRGRALKGGSALELAPYQSWLDVIIYFPWGFFTFLFRPFFWEAGNLFGSLAALENLILLILTLASVRWWWPYLKQTPSFLPLFLLTIGIVSVFAILGGNLGTMFRLKIHVLPFLLILVTYSMINSFKPSELLKNHPI